MKHCSCCDQPFTPVNGQRRICDTCRRAIDPGRQVMDGHEYSAARRQATRKGLQTRASDPDHDDRTRARADAFRHGARFDRGNRL